MKLRNLLVVLRLRAARCRSRRPPNPSRQDADERRPRGRCWSASCSTPAPRPARSSTAKYFDERGWLVCVERWGGDDGPDDAIENCNDWPILHALGGSGRGPHALQEGVGGAPPPVHPGQDDAGPVRARRHVLQRVPRHVRLAPQRRGADRLSTCRGSPTRGDASFRPRARRYAGLLPERGPRRAQLRPEAQDHPQPVQRQPRPAAPQGDRARLGRRPDRGRRTASSLGHGETQLRRDARALQGLQRHRRRPPAEPAWRPRWP